MKTKNRAFTLVELLVVVSILGLISVFTISGIIGVLEERAIHTKISGIQEHINMLDRSIEDRQNYNYTMTFTGGLDWYKTNINTNGTDHINVDKTDIPKLKFTKSFSGDSKLKIIKDNKVLYNSGFINTYEYQTRSTYKVIGYLSGATEVTELNTIEIRSFDPEKGEIILSSPSSFTISNTRGSKKNPTTNITFERFGKEASITLK